jgi:hypothetical protein
MLGRGEAGRRLGMSSHVFLNASAIFKKNFCFEISGI